MVANVGTNGLSMGSGGGVHYKDQKRVMLNVRRLEANLNYPPSESNVGIYNYSGKFVSVTLNVVSE